MKERRSRPLKIDSHQHFWQPARGEAVLQSRHAGGRPAVEERCAVVGLDDVAADVSGSALVEEVDRDVVAGHHA